MKTIALFICLVLGAMVSMAQTEAVTSSGDKVLLYDDGTWAYASDIEIESTEIKTNKTEFFVPDGSSFQVKSNVVDVGVFLNPKKWGFEKATSNGSAEYEFELKGKDAYGMLITERIEIPLENLKGIALENARNVAPDVRVVKEEYRMVNGKKVFFMQMNGTTQGIKFTYLGYYYAYSEGTIQFVTYTSQSLLEEYRPDMEELLNGFVIQD
jgi:hypothetical protein